MTDIIRITITFVLVVILMKRKINLGIAMGIGAMSLAIFYLLPISDIKAVMISTVSSYATIQMILALGLIMVLEHVMRTTMTFKQMMDSLRLVVRDIRVILAAPPAIIGMVPSIGGAYFSAPLVQEASNAIPITPERKGFINYWFRHIWEYILPTYPGILLVSAITHIPLGKIIIYQAPFAVMVVLTGIIFCFRDMPIHTPSAAPSCSRPPIPEEFYSPLSGLSGRDLLRFIVSLLPIIMILILVALFHVDIALTMVAVTIFMFVYHRYPLKRIRNTFKESVSWKVILIIVGVMFFKEMVGATGAVEGMSFYLTETGFPLIILFFLLPFLVGVLTGLTIAFVGTTFPLLISLSGGSPDIGKMAFAFASGFTGVMFSPVHLCLVLTGEYFSANKTKIYQYMIIPSSMIMLLALLMWIVK